MKLGIEMTHNKNKDIEKINCQLDVVGNKLWIIAKESSENLSDTLTVKGIENPLTIQWHDNKNDFLKALVSGFNLIKNGTFGNGKQKSISGWDIDVKEPASAQVDLSEEWHLKGGHTAFLVAPTAAERPRFLAKHKILVIDDGSVDHRFSGFFATHRAGGSIRIDFYDKSDNKLGGEIINIPFDPQYSGGQSLASYAYIESVFTPVEEAQYMRLNIELGKQEDFSEPDACLFFTELYLGQNNEGVSNEFILCSESIDRLAEKLFGGVWAKFGHVQLPIVKELSTLSISYIDSTYKIALKNELRPLNLKEEQQLKEVDLEFYLALYPDLRELGIINQLQASVHYFKYGEKEARIPSLEKWGEKNHLEDDFLNGSIFKNAIKFSYSNSNKNEFKDVLDVLSGKAYLPIKLAETDKNNGLIYTKLAKNCFIKGEAEKGRTLLQIALSFNKCAHVLELIGNTYFDEKNYSIAISYYNESLLLNSNSYWVIVNRKDAYLKIYNINEAFISLTEAIENNGQHSKIIDDLDSVVERLWADRQSEINADAIMNKRDNRDQIIQSNIALAEKIYNSYSKISGVTSLPELGHINTSRILIVGDYHIPQCIRYRIDQKVEQLELLGKEVTTIDWTKLPESTNELATHDIVIFYRVPNTPQVLKAIAQTNAAGKLSIYEIDDLLFDKSYPPPIESYGGYVDLNTYQELMKGMGMFNATARLCRIGIASTRPLAKHLETLVIEKQCWIHRNGLDANNAIQQIDKSHKKTIDIFYGSGTQAHNSDFLELALPAIEKILIQNENVRLIVMGYLKLPTAFISQYKSQLKQMPPVKDVQDYWAFLEQADINIAVLHDDKINASKSELKWFEAACFGIPSIVSDTQNYRDVIQQGEDGYIASTTDDWYKHLKQLIKSPEKRVAMGLNAMQRVQDEYSLEMLGTQLVDNISNYVFEHTPKLKKRKKLVIVNVFFAPQSIGGATRVVEDNFDALLEQYSEEYDICVFTADAECRDSHHLSVYNYKGVRVYRATTLWREHMDWQPKDEKMYDIFTEFLNNEAPDLVHFHCVQRLTASIVEATRDKEIPYLVTAHDAWWISDYQFLVDSDDKVYPEGHPDLFEPIKLPTNISLGESINRRKYLKSLLHDAKQVLTVSEAFANIYRKNEIINIAVTKNGISSKIPWQAKNTSDTEKVVCAHIGGMSAHKGYDLLKKAVMISQPENLAFLIVDHSQEQGYEQSEQWGNVPVTFIGKTKQNEIVKLYQKIDVLFSPSIWPESFGLVTREAAACGCWVVASHLGGIGEDVTEGENGFVIEPSLKGLDTVLVEIEKSPEKFKKAVEIYKLTSVEEQVKEVVGYYE